MRISLGLMSPRRFNVNRILSIHQPTMVDVSYVSGLHPGVCLCYPTEISPARGRSKSHITQLSPCYWPAKLRRSVRCIVRQRSAVSIASFSELTSVMTSQTSAEYVRDKRRFGATAARVWLLIKRRVSLGERNPE